MLNVNAKILARAIALARTAASANENESAAAIAALTAHCEKHNLPVADIIARAAQPDAVKREPLTDAQRAARDAAKAKPAPKPEAPKAAKPKAEPKAEPKPERAERPTKPADAAKAAAASEREALVTALRATVMRTYNGPSLAVRGNPKRIASAVYSALCAAPKHRTTLDRISVRDESALALIIERGTKAGAFDPAALNLDSGIFSRLASVAFIEACDGPNPFRLTKAGLAHARKAFAKAA